MIKLLFYKFLWTYNGQLLDVQNIHVIEHIMGTLNSNLNLTRKTYFSQFFPVIS